jgi:ketosteroid isomerase-like protein
MTKHPNIGLTRRGYEAFAKGDLTALSELIADDVTWHALGVGPLSGDYHGQAGPHQLRISCRRLRADTCHAIQHRPAGIRRAAGDHG